MTYYAKLAQLTEEVLSKLPIADLETVSSFKGKPYTHLGDYGPAKQVIYAVYSKDIKQTQLYIMPNEFIQRVGEYDDAFEKIVLEQYGTTLILQDHNTEGKLRLRNGHMNFHQLWLREDEDVFRIARMQSSTTLYKRQIGNNDYPFEDASGSHDIEKVNDILEHPELYHIAEQSFMESILFQKDTGHLFVRRNNKPRYNHMNLANESHLFRRVPTFFMDRMLAFAKGLLSEDTQNILKYEPIVYHDDVEAFCHTIRLIHFPNTVHFTKMLMSPEWSRTHLKKETMSKHALVQSFYPNISKKQSKQIASNFELDAQSYNYHDTFDAFFTHYLDNNAFQKHVALKYNTKHNRSLPLINTLVVSAIDDISASFRTIERALKEAGIFELLTRRYHNMIHRNSTDDRRTYLDHKSIFSDTLSMFVQFYSADKYGNRPTLEGVDLNRLFQHATSEFDVHDALVREMRRARDEETEISRLASIFDFELEDEELALEDTIGDFKIQLPKSSEQLQHVGDDLNICVGWGYPERMRDRQLHVFYVTDKEDKTVACIELSDDLSKVKQAKLKYNRRIEANHALYEPMIEWIQANHLSIHTSDISIEQTITYEMFPEPAPMVAEDRDVLPF